jgi:hypothetical protein
MAYCTPRRGRRSDWWCAGRRFPIRSFLPQQHPTRPPYAASRGAAVQRRPAECLANARQCRYMGTGPATLRSS